MFRGEISNFTNLVEQIKIISWIWFIGRSGCKYNFVSMDWLLTLYTIFGILESFFFSGCKS
jgi:hypothetical protein